VTNQVDIKSALNVYKYFLYSMVLLGLVFHAGIACGNDFTFKAVPASCVALHKGQRCFMDLALSWQSSGKMELCVFRDNSIAAIACSSKSQVQVNVKYSSDKAHDYWLRDKAGNTLASVQVKTAWVYRTGRRSSSSWRLF